MGTLLSFSVLFKGKLWYCGVRCSSRFVLLSEQSTRARCKPVKINHSANYCACEISDLRMTVPVRSGTCLGSSGEATVPAGRGEEQRGLVASRVSRVG